MQLVRNWLENLTAEITHLQKQHNDYIPRIKLIDKRYIYLLIYILDRSKKVNEQISNFNGWFWHFFLTMNYQADKNNWRY